MVRFRASLSVAAVALAVVAADTADAGRYNESIRVKLDSVHGAPARGGRFLIRYEVSRRSWARIRKARVPATVYIYTEVVGRNGVKRHFRWAAPLERSGRVWLNRKTWRGWDKVSIEIHGAHDDAIIDGLQVGRRRTNRWEWSLPGNSGPPPRPRPRPRPEPAVSYTKLLKVCTSHFMGTRNRESCVSIGKKLPPRGALAIVRQCANHFMGTRNRFKCMRGGIGWRAGAPFHRVVDSCADHFMGTRNRIKCHQTASRIRSRELLAIIDRCADSNIGTRNRLRCIKAAW